MNTNGERLGPLDTDYAEELYRSYRDDPESVPPGWRTWFTRLDEEGSTARVAEERARSVFDPRSEPESRADSSLQERVERIVAAHLRVGHRAAQLDPLGRNRPQPSELDPASYHFSEADLDRRVEYGVGGACDRRPLRWVLRHLRRCYCGTLGVQVVHIRDQEARFWIRRRIESVSDRARPQPADRLHLLQRLSDSAVFEDFLRKKFVGAKSYSMEGAESLLLLLEAAIERAGTHAVEEVVLAMSHRGRLNVLANLLDKPPRRIFAELRGSSPWESGDNGHHLGVSTDRKTAAGHELHLSLCFNPSHLEFVTPIALGRTRAKQDREGDVDRKLGLPLVVHGDAAFAGEGVVYESLNLSGLAAYDTGGCVHVIADNQIGFTTTPDEGRSTEYASDLALMLDAPILHVCADDPEAVARAARIAIDYRQEFGRDIVIDLHGYRRWGHNEIDEPRFTQPLMYALIDALEPAHEIYRKRLAGDGLIDDETAKAMTNERHAFLQAELEALEGLVDDSEIGSHLDVPVGVWKGMRGGPVADRDEVDTTVTRERLRELLEAMTRAPSGFDVHPKVERVLEARRKMATGEQPLDWAAAESLAFASLAMENRPVRMTGQDSVRGTFSQRHAALFDQTTGERYEPLQHLGSGQATVEIENSPLAEAGVLGFEYGYSLDRPNGLVIWEAQFGDFANAAQVVMDQFIASGEDKWRRLSAITLLLPHGFEGQGPEHSSARLERFLTAFAEDNIQVVQPTTPAQYFHLLRRQVLREWKKPLIVLTPKSLLRHPACVSSLASLESGGFRRVLNAIGNPDGVRKVLLCSGKLAFELEKHRNESDRSDIGILRLEELAPFPIDELRAELNGIRPGTPVVWVQDEPENMGAWRDMRVRFGAELFESFPFSGVSRDASASPAGGSKAEHLREQSELIDRAFEEPQ